MLDGQTNCSAGPGYVLVSLAVTRPRRQIVRFLKSNAIALLALVFAMTGTGIAASHYVITSTSRSSRAY